MSSPTRHDPNKVLLGTVGSSDRVASENDSDPASFPSGTVCQLASTGLLSTSSGSLIGVSLGESLSDTKKTSVCRVGNRVPVLLDDEGDSGFGKLTQGDLTFEAKVLSVDVGDNTIALVDGGVAGNETVDVVGTDIVVNMDDGVSTAQQIADAIAASDVASDLISVSIAAGQGAVAQDAFAETNLDGITESFSYVEIGTAVEVSSGKAVSSGTATGACWIDSVKIGVKIDGSLVPVGVIDMGGGL